jgi:hypothetical protein
MYVIKLDKNHLKMHRFLENKKLKIDILSDKENKRICITDAVIELQQLNSFQILIQLQGQKQDNL